MKAPSLTARRLVLPLLFALLAAFPAFAGDWPEYRHDVNRSGFTPDQLPADQLGEAWVWQSSLPPESAWDAPAKWDAWGSMMGLKSMRNYDPVFHPIIVGNRAYFGSSADDAVHCLDLESGEELWVYITDAPVRIAPTFVDGKLYFGSDDGYAYCITADTGQLVWKFSPTETNTERRLINDGRLISFWPCRTGVVVAEGTAYFGCSLFPWKASYLCAVDAETGQPAGEGRFIREINDQSTTLEGALIASRDLLVMPQGRIPPRLYDRHTGDDRGQLPGGGGCFVVMTPEDQFVHGPGNKTGWLTASNSGGAQVAQYQAGKSIVVAGDHTYILTEDGLIATDHVQQQQLWVQSLEVPCELIVAGDTVFVGEEDKVQALSGSDGSILWEAPITGKAYGLAAADGALLVSTDTGALYCFRPGATPPAVTGAHENATEEATPAEETPREPLADVVAVDDDALIGRWVVHPELTRRNGAATEDRLARGDALTDLAGDLPAELEVSAELDQVGPYQALVLDGMAGITLAGDHSDAHLPAEAVTASAWVRIEEPLVWGGIVGAVQDNGDQEFGWLLGYNNQKFSFGLASVDGPPTLNYMPTAEDFELGKWYHVVGTYDGTTQALYVNGQLVASATDHHGAIKYPAATPYVIGAYQDSDEFYAMNGQLHEVRVYDRALTAEEIGAQFNEKAAAFIGAENVEPVYYQVASGPYAEFTGPSEATIHWETAEPTPSLLIFGQGETPDEWLRDAEPTTQHSVVLSDLGRNRVYTYEVVAGEEPGALRTEPYQVDTYFDYVLGPAPDQPDPWAGQGDERYAQAADYIVSQTGTGPGICIVYDCGDGRLVYEIAKRSQLRVIGLSDDESEVAAAREKLYDTGLYGIRATVLGFDDLADLPLPGMFGNVVVSAAPLTGSVPAGSAAEMARLVRPDGGLLLLGAPAMGNVSPQGLTQWLSTAEIAVDPDESDAGVWARHERLALPGAGQWTHMYGGADNSAYGGESLSGAKNISDLDVQWVGRPGPRYHVDRQGRKNSPLSVGGRLYLQGLQRMIALDAYNGTPLWSLELPTFMRFNIPRDASNWCADDDSVYAVMLDRCWKIDGATGEVAAQFPVLPGPRDDFDYEWGYVGRIGDTLIGSAVKSGSPYLVYWGHDGWYDGTNGPHTFKVCSDNLFGLDPATGQQIWSYSGGVIINTTIVGGENEICFIESRNTDLLASDERRVGSDLLWQDRYMVALDPATGEKLWERAIEGEPGVAMYSLAYGSGHLVLVASNNNQYHVAAFDSASGEDRWERVVPWPSNNHGGHLSRPAIVGGTVYVRPSALNLSSGDPQSVSMPGGGCGTYACTDDAIFFRSGPVTMFDRESGGITQWQRLRPDCWLSTIPAGGMLLSPEGGGGCSCGSWLETSIGFVPVALADGAETDAP